MKVICRSRKRSELTTASCKPYASEIAYELAVDATYTVYGQYLAEGCLSYLIAPRDRQGLSRPSFYPAEFFSVVDGSIPSSWVFRCQKENRPRIEGIFAVWGYSELVESEDHFLRLVECEEDALFTFVRRKKQIDAEEKERNI
jgi:hypothetical protein